MALKNRDNNKKYLKLKDGKFYINKEETPYEELEGTITNIRYKDEEYEGAPIRKLAIVISDEDDNYELGLNVESSNYTSLVSFLKNVDINRPLTLHPKVDVQNKDGKEVTRRSILVSQDGKYAKSYFSVSSGNTTPEWKIVKVGNKKITDKTEFLEFYEDFVKENFIAKLNSGDLITKEDAPVTKKQPEVEDDTFDPDEKLPWE
jgi:hypothetical protein